MAMDNNIATKHGCALRALPLPARTYPLGEQSVYKKS